MTAPALATQPESGGPARAPLAPEAPARALELFGRLALAGGLAAAMYAIWAPRLSEAAGWTQHGLCVLPRMSVFVLAAMMALIIQGARTSLWFLLGAGAAAAVLGALLLNQADAAGMFSNPQCFDLPLARSGPPLQLSLFIAVIFSAILAGAAIGRGLATPAHFITFLLCAAAGDIWLNSHRVAETADSGSVLRLLRMPWPMPAGRLALSPAFTDVLALSAVIESARRLRMHAVSVVAGAVSGYCAGSFLGVSSANWGALSLLMFSSGILIGCWPDLRCNIRDVAKAVAVSLLLFGALLGVSRLHHKLRPGPRPPEDPARYRRFT
jgi:hypothetical protein